MLVSENNQKIFNDAFKEIGICREAIKNIRIAIKDDVVVNESFLSVNLFKDF